MAQHGQRGSVGESDEGLHRLARAQDDVIGQPTCTGPNPTNAGVGSTLTIGIVFKLATQAQCVPPLCALCVVLSGSAA